MTPESEQLVRDSWVRLEGAHDDLIAAFYARLFEANPAAHDLFASTNMTEQRRKFAAMMGEIMRVLDDPDLLVSEVAASGLRHVKYGVQDRDYDDVGAALLWALQSKLGSAFTPAQIGRAHV